MDEMNINLATEAATETANAVAKAVESAAPVTTKAGITLSRGEAITLGVTCATCAAGAGILTFIGAKKAVAAIKDFHEYRALKKKGAMAKVEATEKSADGEVKPVEADVVQNEEPSNSKEE